MKELKITKEKILEAANKCNTSKEILKTLFPEAFEEERTYTRGQRFTVKDFPGTFLLTQTGRNLACLVDLSNGNRFIEPIEVQDIFQVTYKELKSMAGGRKVTLVE